MTPEEEAAFAAWREKSAALYAAVLDNPDGRARVYGAAMVALSFCASAEGFPRFRRWLYEKPAQCGVPDAVGDVEGWSRESVTLAAKVLAAWTILEHERKSDGP